MNLPELGHNKGVNMNLFGCISRFCAVLRYGTRGSLLRSLFLILSVSCLFVSSSWALSATMNSNGAGGHSATDTSGGMVGINVAEGSLTWTVSETAGIWDYLYVYTPAQINNSTFAVRLLGSTS